MQLEFATQKLAQRSKQIGFCRVIIQLNTKEVCDIDFSAAQALKKNLDAKVVNYTDTKSAPVTQKTCFGKYATLTSNELNSCFNKLSKSGTKPAILSIVRGCCNEYAPQLLTKSYPKSLLDLYDSKLACLNCKEHIDYCQNVSIIVTAEQQSNVEVATRKQHLSKNWFYFRTGRITASYYCHKCLNFFNKRKLLS